MKKILLSSLLITSIASANQKTLPLAKNPTQEEWISVKIEQSYIASLDLEKRGCVNVFKKVKEIQKRNPNINLNNVKIGDTLNLPACKTKDLYKATYKEKNPKPVQDWRPIVITKNQVISARWLENNCHHLWGEQIDFFKEKNPELKDVNKIAPGTKVLMQHCEAPPSEQLTPPALVQYGTKTHQESNTNVSVYGGLGLSSWIGTHIGTKISQQLEYAELEGELNYLNNNIITTIGLTKNKIVMQIGAALSSNQQSNFITAGYDLQYFNWQITPKLQLSEKISPLLHIEYSLNTKFNLYLINYHNGQDYLNALGIKFNIK